jgi:hypothetical protein
MGNEGAALGIEALILIFRHHVHCPVSEFRLVGEVIPNRKNHGVAKGIPK